MVVVSNRRRLYQNRIVIEISSQDQHVIHSRNIYVTDASSSIPSASRRHVCQYGESGFDKYVISMVLAQSTRVSSSKIHQKGQEIMNANTIPTDATIRSNIQEHY